MGKELNCSKSLERLTIKEYFRICLRITLFSISILPGQIPLHVATPTSPSIVRFRFGRLITEPKMSSEEVVLGWSTAWNTPDYKWFVQFLRSLGTPADSRSTRCAAATFWRYGKSATCPTAKRRCTKPSRTNIWAVPNMVMPKPCYTNKNIFLSQPKSAPQDIEQIGQKREHWKGFAMWVCCSSCVLYTCSPLQSRIHGWRIRMPWV